MIKNNNGITLVCGGKGGVGKTVVTNVIACALRADGIAVHLIDCDASNPDVFKAWVGRAEVSVCRIDGEDGFLALADIMENRPDTHFLVNTPAGATAAIIENGDLLLDVAEAQGRKVSVVWPINAQIDGLQLLADFVDISERYHAVTVVLNSQFGPPEVFKLYNESGLKQRVTRTIVLPKLADVIANQIQNLRLNFEDAQGCLQSIARDSALRRFREAAIGAVRVIYV